MPGRRMRAAVRRLKERIALNRRTFVLYSVLRVLVIVTLVRCIMTQRWEGVAICALVLVLFLVPALIEDRGQLEIPPLFQNIIYIFIFAAEILGEVDHYYVLVPGWDTVLHTINGFLCAAVGFSLVDLLNRSSKRVSLSPVYVTLVAFCFSMTVGVLWEFVEFGFDTTLGLDMQKDTVVTSISTVSLDPTHTGQRVRIDDIRGHGSHPRPRQAGRPASTATTLDINFVDTMKDLLVNFVGAVAFSVIGYRHLSHSEPPAGARGCVLRPSAPAEDREEEQQIDRMGQGARPGSRR